MTIWELLIQGLVIGLALTLIVVLPGVLYSFAKEMYRLGKSGNESGTFDMHLLAMPVVNASMSETTKTKFLAQRAVFLITVLRVIVCLLVAKAMFVLRQIS